jgi:hypothetical protein
MDTIKDTHTTIAAMKDASKQLKIEHKKINLNEIEDLNDDLADMFEDVNEISEVRRHATSSEIFTSYVDARKILWNTRLFR